MGVDVVVKETGLPALRPYRALFCSMLIGAATSCSAFGPGPRASPTPLAIPSTSPGLSLAQPIVALPAATAAASLVPVALPVVAGFVPTMLFPRPQTAVNAQLTVLISNVAPSSAPPLAFARLVQTIRYTAALPGGATPLLYTVIYSTATITLPTAPGFTFVIPSGDVFAGANYYLALYDPARPNLSWQYAFEGRASVANRTLTFASNPAPFTLAGSAAYYFALIVIPQGRAQPTPAPSVSPTNLPSQAPPTSAPGGGSITIIVPTPSPVLCTPAPVAVTVGQTLVIDCSAQDDLGPFTWQVADPTIASVQLSNPQLFTYFTVTGRMAGTTTLSLSDQPGGTGSVTITVSP